MLKNYFLIAWRNLLKQKIYSVIKIGGFALSIAACLLIALYIKDELSYDKSWPAANRIYRIVEQYNENGKIEFGVDLPAPMAKALKEDFPEVEKAGRLMPDPSFYGGGNNQIRRADQEQNTYEEGFTYADQDILDMLQVKMIYGERSKALAEPNTIVLTRNKADKYFPNQNPVGKIMLLNNDKARPYKVGGVIENFPCTSHLKYDFLLTLTGHEFWSGEQSLWLASNYPTYVLLKQGTNAAQFQNKLKLILKKYFTPARKQAGNVDAYKIEQSTRYLVQPIGDIHLYSYNIDDDMEKGDVRFVWLFGAVAAFILIIACINFINLSTAKSANRAKEVGLRKVVGSYRSSLVWQFLVESLLFSVLSFVIGVMVAALLLPYFNTLSAKSLVIPWTDWWLLPIIAAASVVVGIIAGIYPAFYLSSFQPINVLKGQVNRGSKPSVLRNGLVVFQFATSIILMISTLVIYKQTKFILTKKIGFDKDQVLLLQGTNTLDDKAEVFKKELQQLSQVKAVSTGDYLPIVGTKRDGNPFWKEGRTKIDPAVGAQKWRADYDYVSTLGIKLIEGRNFSRDMASDSAAVIINKTMAKELGLKHPIGQRIENGWEKFTVIGIVEDFNFELMKQNIGPLSIILCNDQSSMMSVKMNGSEAKNAIASISALWKKFAPNQPFRYTFMDESFANMYADVQRTGDIFTSFAVFAIIIACLGLFALSAFMAEQRTKEVGIRKVLGASVNSIATMLSKGFVKLILISIAIASPVSWWIMTKWLQDFAYRIHIDWTLFVVAGLLALMIAIVTVSFQAIRAAVANPIKSLRTE
jgi:putative ABC transport system permease protein